jgi:small subunit ribosomal protein S16
MIKKHLLEGVKKGAFDETEAARRFEEWLKQNEAKLESKKSNLEKSLDEAKGKRIEAEKRINEARAAKIAKKLAALEAKEAAEASPAAEAAESAEPASPSAAESVEESPRE